MPCESKNEFARSEFWPISGMVDGQVERNVRKNDDAAAVKHRPDPIDGLGDFGFSGLLEHGLASGIRMHLHRHDIGPAVPHASAAGLSDVLTDRNKRLGVGCSKRSGQPLDRLRGWLLAAHDDDVFTVLVAIQSTQSAEMRRQGVRWQIGFQGASSAAL